MKALVKLRSGVGHVELTDMPEPLCTPDGVKIEVAYTGICGTDLHVFHDRFRNYPPVILGHEFSGIVVEVGSEVTRIAPGERVTVLPSSAVVCGECEYCRSGYYMFCAVRRGMGHGVHGSFAPYAVVRQDMVYKLPARVGLKQAALAEPFACAVQAVDELTRFRAGDTVLLSGPGPIGLLCLTMLVAHRCKVIVAGTASDEARLQIAKRLGAALTVDISKEDLQSVILEETRGRGVDIAVNCSGAESSVRSSIEALRKRGKLVQVGIVGHDITLPFDQFLFKQLEVFGSVGHSLQSWEGVMRIFEQGAIDLDPVITHVLPLDEWRTAFDLCERKEGGKVLLACGPN